MRFAIFTHVEHQERKGRYYAYAPYVREMNLWLKHVDEVEVVAPQAPKGGDSLFGQDYIHSNLFFTSITALNLLSIFSTSKAFLKIPSIIFEIVGAMRKADHLHLRCPGNVGLLACICQIFFPGKPKSAKYAGNWDSEAKQPWTYRLQKWILSNTFLTRNMQVLVYGDWPDQFRNIKPFFTASFSEKEKAEVCKKTFSGAFTFLFVGNLVEGKRPLEAVKLVEELQNKNQQRLEVPIKSRELVNVRLEIYGDGPERHKLEKYVKDHKLEDLMFFHGSRPLEELKAAYQNAHFVILPSKSEGWPKAIAEGMFFGCIPIATPVSCVPWMLGSPPAPEGGAKNYSFGKRGILIEEFDTFQKSRQFEYFSTSPQGELKNVSRTGFSETLEVTNKEWSEDREQEVEKILNLLSDQERMKKMSEEAKKWSQEYTLEKFEAAIQEILNKKPETTNQKQKCESYS